MRVTIIALCIVATLAAGCDRRRPPAAAASDAPPPPAGANLIEAATPQQWTLRNASLADQLFTLERGGVATVAARATPATPGQVYRAEVAIAADGQGRADLRITQGCGTKDAESSTVTFPISAGSKTLQVAHVFMRPARCAHLLIVNRESTPLRYRLESAKLTAE
jgi:hypothetical protein